MKVKGLRIGAIYVAIFLINFGGTALAQQGSEIGRVVEADGGAPFVGATVRLEELNRETQSAADGTYRFDNLPPGTYHVAVRADGYATQRHEVSAGAAVPDVALRLDLHYSEVISVSRAGDGEEF